MGCFKDLPKDVVTYLMTFDLDFANTLSRTSKRQHDCFMTCIVSSPHMMQSALYHYCRLGLVHAYDRLKAVAKQRFDSIKDLHNYIHVLANYTTDGQRELLRKMVADEFVVTEETLDYALLTGNASVVQNLLASSAKTTAHQFLRACSSGNTPIVKLMLKAGADPNAKVSYCQESPIELAALCGQSRVVGVLLDQGCLPDNAPELVQRIQRFHPKAARRLINDARIRQVWGMYQFD